MDIPLFNIYLKKTSTILVQVYSLERGGNLVQIQTIEYLSADSSFTYNRV